MKKWNELTMSERAEAIRVAVKNGITDLGSIRDKYNEFAEGGDLNSIPDNRSVWEGNKYEDGGIFENEVVDNIASFLPILGTAEDAYTFYKDPSLANAGWLTASLASDIFTGGMAGRAIKAVRAANKAVDAANATTKAARRTWKANKLANVTGQNGPNTRRSIEAVKAAGDSRNAAIRRANDALFGAGVSVGIDQGLNGFLNVAQQDLLPTFGLDNQYAKGGSIHIKPSKRGTFTAAAKKHGKSVQEFASQVLAHKENYSSAMVKKANFAKNASKWKH